MLRRANGLPLLLNIGGAAETREPFAELLAEPTAASMQPATGLIRCDDAIESGAIISTVMASSVRLRTSKAQLCAVTHHSAAPPCWSKPAQTLGKQGGKTPSARHTIAR